jgi:hypothetical protein
MTSHQEIKAANPSKMLIVGIARQARQLSSVTRMRGWIIAAATANAESILRR